MTWWRAAWRNIVAALASAVIGWFAFVADRPVPLLDWFDLGIHEVGHMITFAAPELVMFMAGSFAQIAFPVAMAVYFLRFRRDLPSGGFCLAWAGTSAWDVSVYVADAPIQALPLIGGGRHDWAYILGRFDAIDQAGRVAGWIETTGAAVVLAGIAVALIPLVKPVRQSRPRPVPRAGLTVREVRDHTPPEPGTVASGHEGAPPAPAGSGSFGEPAREDTSALPPDPGVWDPPELLPEDPFDASREFRL
jgi:hypothetical protein